MGLDLNLTNSSGLFYGNAYDVAGIVSNRCQSPELRRLLGSYIGFKPRQVVEMRDPIDSAFKIFQNEMKLSVSTLNNLVNAPALLLPSALVFSLVSYLHIAMK